MLSIIALVTALVSGTVHDLSYFDTLCPKGPELITSPVFRIRWSAKTPWDSIKKVVDIEACKEQSGAKFFMGVLVGPESLNNTSQRLRKDYESLMASDGLDGINFRVYPETTNQQLAKALEGWNKNGTLALTMEYQHWEEVHPAIKANTRLFDRILLIVENEEDLENAAKGILDSDAKVKISFRSKNKTLVEQVKDNRWKINPAPGYSFTEHFQHTYEYVHSY